ncbi:MAG: Maf family nucleotide pyrophosphatase [Candidatus Thiodiazotropha sp. (ex Epidulcina cf. delphinae)]|nr:Maf family nucleotide pyrophosphatase [Candidatus Thiodiazotropha sp. (ex Epidulcina cf. delphinae)]
MTRNPLIYLASRSPRRRELLRQIGVSHSPADIEVDECVHPAESPEAYVLRLAIEKVRAGLLLTNEMERLPVLAADTTVVIGGEILGKPRDREQGLSMLRRLSGHTHEVYTAVALGSRRIETRLSLSRVTFRPMSGTEIEAYWESGEPADKAGGYAIQGLGAQFVKELQGSYSGVMGLPLFETAELLRGEGIELMNPERAVGR